MRRQGTYDIFLVVQGYAYSSSWKNGIHVHLHILHFQSFRTRVILYPSHFAQCCLFHPVLIFSCSGCRPEKLYWGGSLRRLSVCLSVCKHVCRRTGIFFGTCTIWYWKEHSDQVSKEKSARWSWRRCDDKKMFTDRWLNGCRRGPPQKSSSTSSSANDQGIIIEGIRHTLRIQLPGELYEDGSDMRTYR